MFLLDQTALKRQTGYTYTQKSTRFIKYTSKSKELILKEITFFCTKMAFKYFLYICLIIKKPVYIYIFLYFMIYLSELTL